ncbi:MAG TPA: phosphonoacetate hydrolase [Rhodospirillales bacterium]|jgi:phosphonoacetate hydrolase|nr:MAG: Phosphonoacetate hydrolase [Alphaproteobacteria bacterium MarineAlpha3_Bin2]HIM24423.1 phosphonoacetate hydrolase [Rhodospirillales bacterium]
MAGDARTVELNGRSYQWPEQPVVVVCIDGSEPGYVEAAVETGKAPFFERILAEGTNRLADCVIPSFTNPNNMSIVTGTPPNVHGIAANFFHDRDSGEDVMTNTPKFLWVDTIFKAFFDAGGKVAIVTAKDKLTSMLGHGLDFSSGRAIGFSSEKSDKTTMANNGIDRADQFVGLPVPEVYSADLSAFIFAAGVKLVERDRPDLMYLSTTDYIQHKYAPGTPVANDFYIMMDGYLSQLDDMGCVIALTADHGMNAKHNDAGDPDAIYLQDIIDEWDLGGQNGDGTARVVLTITDPYVVHHGALGSFCTVYLSDGADEDAIAEKIRGLDGVLAVYNRADGCAEFELPEERMGDLIVISEKHKVLGSSAASHDLSGLNEPLRSHGGLTEQKVPLLMNKPSPGLDDDRRLRNFDIFDVALNFAG